MVIATLLPVFALWLFFRLAMEKTSSDSPFGRIRKAALLALVYCGAALTLITEVFGAFSQLHFTGLILIWTALSAMLFLTWRSCASSRYALLRELRAFWSSLSIFSKSMVLGACAVVAVTGFIAVVSPPNNYDSMVYHMTRVAHWAQNRSVDYYPANSPWQNYQAPWAEYAILQLQILSGGDRLANLVQWGSLIGCIFSVSLISESLGADSNGQVIAMALMSTLPMGILQATTTQTDLTAGFWLCAFIALSLRCDPDRPSCYLLGGAGLALGLSVLTKTTCYFFAFPFAVLILIRLLRASGPRRWERTGFAALAFAGGILILNGAFFCRNYRVYGSPLGPMAAFGSPQGPNASSRFPKSPDYFYDESRFVTKNELNTPAGLTSNVIRNAAIELETPWATINQGMQDGIKRLHDLIGLSPDDPRTTWTGMNFKVDLLSFRDDDSAASPLHALLIVFALGSVGVLHCRKRREWSGYAVALFSAMLMFCLLIKWGPWHARYHLPLFLAACPLVAVTMARILSRKVCCLCALILFSYAGRMLPEMRNRPFWGARSVFTTSREDLYFNGKPDLSKPYRLAADLIHQYGYSRVGMATHTVDYDYPFWAMVKAGQQRPVRIENLAVRNFTEKLTQGDLFIPDAVLCQGCEPDLISHYVSVIGPACELQSPVVLIGVNLECPEQTPRFTLDGLEVDWWMLKEMKVLLRPIAKGTLTIRATPLGLANQPPDNALEVSFNGIPLKTCEFTAGTPGDCDVDLDSLIETPDDQGRRELLFTARRQVVPNDQGGTSKDPRALSFYFSTIAVVKKTAASVSAPLASPPSPTVQK